MNLHGTWTYHKGVEGDQHTIPVFDQANTFTMPGTTNENKIGTPLDTSKMDDKEIIKCLREEYNYLGVMWYQTTVDITKDMLIQDIELFLERVMVESRVYINGQYINRCTSLSTPHTYWITDALQPGTNTITVRVDNNDIEQIGVYASAMTVDTQTVWNGIIGRMELIPHPKRRLEDITIVPDYSRQLITVRCNIIGTFTTNEKPVISLQAITKGKKHQISTYDINIESGTVELTYMMRQALPWSEFSPNVYQLNIQFDGHTYHETFGMRDVTTKGRQILINEVPTFFLGTLECAIFPLTGYPPTTRPYWEKIVTQLTSYGLNHIRFHSWCPPEVAFDVADQYGVYLQVEAPLWMDRWMNLMIGDKPSHYTYIPEESKRILSTYGNHPSLVIFSNGNELNGDFQLLSDNIKQLKQTDPRFLYTLTSNWDRPIDPMDDIFIAQTVDGVGIRGQYYHNEMASATTLAFSEGIARRDVPTIVHEVGQYTVFPHMDEIKKYTGSLRPVNLEYIYQTLEQKGLLPLAKDYMINSGKTSMLLYRDEIESALRTPYLGGIQLLDIHDFPGQSTAHVGLLDSFWDEKGLMEKSRFTEFSNRVVPLLELDKRVFISGERITYSISVANYLPHDIDCKMIMLELTGPDIQIEESLYVSSIRHGNVHRYITSEMTLPNVDKAVSIQCALRICDTEYINHWTIHIMPDEEPQEGSIFTSLSPAFDQAVEAGERILFNPPGGLVKDAIPGGFFPVFWSPVHFTSSSPNGLVIPKDHPIFDEFPTEEYADYRWRTLLDHSVNIPITNKSIQPIIDVIPNFIVAERLTNLFEVEIGSARVVVTTMNVSDNLTYRHEARTLHNSILSYLKGPLKDCPNRMTLEEFKTLFLAEEDASTSHQLKGNELGKGKPSTASSSAEDHPPYLGNNGLNYTCWAAGDTEIGHYYDIDLENVYLLYGTKIVFEQARNYLYVIQVSLDGETYQTVVNQTGQTSTDQTRVDIFQARGRYVRLVYNGLPNNTRAGHIAFDIYGE
jgi:hypothetical protein